MLCCEYIVYVLIIDMYIKGNKYNLKYSSGVVLCFSLFCINSKCDITA